MTRFVLGGGAMHKAPDGGKAFCDELVKDISHRPIKILDCMFARQEDAWEERFGYDKSFFSKNIEGCVVEAARPEVFLEQIKEADIVMFQGGTPQQLIATLGAIDGWYDALKGKTIGSTSAGTDMFVSYYAVGKTGRIGSGLGMLPLKVINHWKSIEELAWDELRNRLEAHNEKLEVVTLSDGEFVVRTIE